MTAPSHLSALKVRALRSALSHRDLFCSGICTIPDHQRFLYYIHDDLVRRIDFCNAGADDLEALYRACKPAEFGRNGENVLDESYRKAGKMELTSFSTLFDPRNFGIHKQVSKALLTRTRTTVEMELYKLNVYGKGDFFMAHKDTPRDLWMFASLVVVLPTPHEGGQFVLRQGEREWTLDFADKLATATEPSAGFVAFYGDVEHEVLPVTSGYRVTLTYNLYSKPIHPGTSSIPTPFQLGLKQALVDLVNDRSTLPNGGYLGFGLAHEYVHRGEHPELYLLLDQLKGSDYALADVCKELGLDYSLRFLYRDITEPGLSLISFAALDVNDPLSNCYESNNSSADYLREALERFSIEVVEGVNIVGEEYQFELGSLDDSYRPWLETFYRDPVTEVLEITSMRSSMSTHSPFVSYGNEVEVHYFYGTACMLVAVGSAESRTLLGKD